MKTFEDPNPIRAAFEEPGKGRLPVIDGGGSLRYAVIGDHMAGLVLRNGWAGVILYGAVRDSEALDTLDIEIKALGTIARRPAAAVGGIRNTRIREAMEFDVVVVGAGPAGLSAAIRLKQLASDTSVCVVEKGSEVGAHILSGAVLEPRALNELIPDWQARGAPLTTPAGEDRFLYLTERRAWRLPTLPQMHNHGTYIVSLGDVCRWLGQQAEALGVEIYPGFTAAELLTEDGRVLGVATGDMGLEMSGEHGPNYQPGMELRAPYTLFAEGCQGNLTKQLMVCFDLRAQCQPQTYALGIKELWEVPPHIHRRGLIEHTICRPLDPKTYGGSWLYHWGDNLVSYGFVVGLDYSNPWLSPFEEMQRSRPTRRSASTSRAGAGSAMGASTQRGPLLSPFPS